jgi:hypothetical protein
MEAGWAPLAAWRRAHSITGLVSARLSHSSDDDDVNRFNRFLIGFANRLRLRDGFGFDFDIQATHRIRRPASMTAIALDATLTAQSSN